ncbi:MAG: tetratricopeptide repeat-containing sensor histidine kinase [Bacteroidota bacterium]
MTRITQRFHHSLQYSILTLLLLYCTFNYGQSSILDSLTTISTNHLNDTFGIRALREISKIKLHSNLVASKEAALKSIELAKKLKDKKGIFDGYALLGDVYFYQGELAKALEYDQLYLKTAQANKDKKEISKAYNNLGSIYNEIGDYLKALNFYQSSLKIKEEMNDYNGIMLTYSNIANIFSIQNDTAKAFVYFNKAIDIAIIQKDKRILSSNYANIGVLYSNFEMLDKAKTYIYKSLKLKKEINDKTGIGRDYNRLGIICKKQKQYNKALEYYNQSLQIYKEAGDNRGLSNIYNNIGFIYLEQNKINDAITILKISETICLLNKLDNNLLDTYNGLSLCYEKNKNFTTSFNYFKKYKTLEDSLFSAENKKQMQNLLLKYESDKKDHQITTLNKDMELKKELISLKNNEISKQNRIRNLILLSLALALTLAFFIYRMYRNKLKLNDKLHSRNTEILRQKNEIEIQNAKIQYQNQKLEDLNATKDKLFSIISHDLKTPFLSIFRVTEAIKNNYELYDEKQKKDFIFGINSESENLCKLLDNLLLWSRSQRGILSFTPDFHNLKDSINEVLSILSQSAQLKEIRIIEDIDSDLYAYCDLNMAMTIFRNLISNAIKFTERKGEIIITSEEIKQHVTISFKDNGTGITESDLRTLFDVSENKTTPGTEKEKGTGLGLILCKEFVEKNNGTIKVISEIGKGSTFLITLPTKEHNIKKND